MGDVVALAVLILCCLAGLGLAVVRLPGTWMILAAAVGYGWWGQWQLVGLWTISILAGIALIGEAVELLLSVLAARRVGASRQAVWGGLIGGLVGMFLLSFIVPIPVVGALAGALVGCFAGATAGELLVRRQLAQGAKVGLFAAMGYAAGMAAKLALALAMSALVITKAVWPADAKGEPAQESSISPARFQAVEDDPDSRRAGNSTFVPHFQQLDDVGSSHQVGCGHPPFFIDETLDDFMQDRGAILG